MNIAVLAPHPDDETLGCGGTLLKHIAQGDSVSWIIATDIPEHITLATGQSQREAEIQQVTQAYGFSAVKRLGFPATRLETIPLGDMIGGLKNCFAELQIACLYLPYPGDIHSDHKLMFEAATAASKCFRTNTVKRILAYETLSETDFGINPIHNGFRPNVFCDISAYMEQKLTIASLYQHEILPPPFPRNPDAIRGLGAFRGATACCRYAEGFMLLKEIL